MWDSLLFIHNSFERMSPCFVWASWHLLSQCLRVVIFYEFAVVLSKYIDKIKGIFVRGFIPFRAITAKMINLKYMASCYYFYIHTYLLGMLDFMFTGL